MAPRSKLCKYNVQGGRIGVVGVYAGFCNHYNIGAFMEKGLTMAAGQVRASLRHVSEAMLACKDIYTEASMKTLCCWSACWHCEHV